MNFLYLRSIPKDIKDEFKMSCLRRGVTMTQMIIELMLSVIRKDVDQETYRELISDTRGSSTAVRDIDGTRGSSSRKRRMD